MLFPPSCPLCVCCRQMTRWRQSLCFSSGSASSGGLGLCGLWRRVLQRNLVKLVSRCPMGRSSLWSISWLRHQMFYPYVTISAAQACKSEDLRNAMSPFSLFLSSFSGTQTILTICEATKNPSGASSKKREREEHLEEPSDWDSIHTTLWHNWSSDAPLKDADPELRLSYGLSVSYQTVLIVLV